MSLIVEDGAGRFDAQSYASVTDVSQYLAVRGQDATWTALSTTQQEALLVRASDYMAQAYRARWRGFRTNATQALCWPRQAVVLMDMPVLGQVDINTVPREVKEAQIELAVRAISLELMPDQERGVLSESVGSLSVTYDRFSPQQKRYAQVDAKLAHLFASNGVTVPVGRV